MKTLTREEQRGRDAARQMLSLNLEARLRNLYREAIHGSDEALVEYQQMIQYAPREMLDRILSMETA